MNDLFRRPVVIHGLIALCLSLTVIMAQVATHPLIVPWADDVVYMSIAAGLADRGVYTDGTFADKALVTGPEGQGMFFAPAYPALLSLVMRLDEGFHRTAECIIRHLDNIVYGCEFDLGRELYMQGCLGALAAFMVWVAAFVLTRRLAVAWGGLLLVLAAPGISVKKADIGLRLDLGTVYSYYARILMTESLIFPLFTAACLLLSIGFCRRRPWMSFAAGAAFGVLALIRPSFPYFVYALAAAALACAAWTAARRLKDFSFPKLALVFVAGYALVVTPWIVRNGVTLQSYTISKGYAPFILTQRAMYDEMKAGEWAISFLYALPGIGAPVTEKLFPEAAYERLDPRAHGGFYHQGNRGPHLAQVAKDAGGRDKVMGYLMREKILKHPLWHLLVTLSLAWSGMWVAGMWSLLTVPAFAGVMVRAAQTRWHEFIVFAAPGWFMLVFNAATSVNVERYNLILLPCLAIATAWAAVRLWDRGVKADVRRGGTAQA